MTPRRGALHTHARVANSPACAPRDVLRGSTPCSSARHWRASCTRTRSCGSGALRNRLSRCLWAPSARPRCSRLGLNVCAPARQPRPRAPASARPHVLLACLQCRHTFCAALQAGATPPAAVRQSRAMRAGPAPPRRCDVARLLIAAGVPAGRHTRTPTHTHAHPRGQCWARPGSPTRSRPPRTPRRRSTSRRSGTRCWGSGG